MDSESEQLKRPIDFTYGSFPQYIVQIAFNFTLRREGALLNMSNILDRLSLPNDLRTQSVQSLEEIVLALRAELIEVIAQSGGHFASSLGVAELTVALHHVFDTPKDRLIWDVGHQAYFHKMVTGRREQLGTIRKTAGISGYLRRDESEYDAFGAGHAGTSISAAVGMAAALRDSKKDSPSVVAVIGDGAMTSGMAFEALNHAGSIGLSNLIVVLNDNEMSIAPNVGALSWLFSRSLTSKTSTRYRSKFKDLHQRGYIPDIVYKAVDRAEEMTQGFISAAAVLFESFGFRYIGPIDGHNMSDLVKALQNAKGQDVPVLVHAYTSKGKGYEPAECDPVKWHATSPFHPEERSKKFEVAPKISPQPDNLPPTYSKVFAESAVKLAEMDPSVVAITAAMPSGTGLDLFAERFPGRFYDVGICEQHAVTFAAGLACEGKLPICAIYSTFLQRGYDQVLHDVCIQKLPVIFAIDRAGVVGNDGETHQGAFDISYLRSIPGLVLMSPKDEAELELMLFTARSLKQPVAIRYPRGYGRGVERPSKPWPLEVGRSEIVSRGKDVLFVTYGPIISEAEKAAEYLLKNRGLSSTIINARFAKPLDVERIAFEVQRHSIVATVEDHALLGGFGSAVLEELENKGARSQAPLLRFGIGDKFVTHGSQAEQYAWNGYDSKHIAEVIMNLAPVRMVAN